VDAITSLASVSACPPPTTVGAFQTPAHLAWVNWSLGAKPLSEISFRLVIDNDPGTAVGFYISPVNATADDTPFYLGLQTDLNSPTEGNVGHGILFSRFGTQDLSQVRPGPTAFTVSAPDLDVDGAHDPPEVSVRSKLAWTPGEYVFTLRREEAEASSDWFDLHVQRADTGTETLLGGILFPRRDPAIPVAITPSASSFFEVYHGLSGAAGTATYAEVPAWHVSLTMAGDRAPATAASSEYPAFPYAVFPNVDVFHADGRVHLVGGGGTRKCHTAGSLF
jgi:hypothetical protein